MERIAYFFSHEIESFGQETNLVHLDTRPLLTSADYPSKIKKIEQYDVENTPNWRRPCIGIQMKARKFDRVMGTFELDKSTGIRARPAKTREIFRISRNAYLRQVQDLGEKRYR